MSQKGAAGHETDADAMRLRRHVQMRCRASTAGHSDMHSKAAGRGRKKCFVSTDWKPCSAWRKRVRRGWRRVKGYVFCLGIPLQGWGLLLSGVGGKKQNQRSGEQPQVLAS